MAHSNLQWLYRRAGSQAASQADQTVQCLEAANKWQALGSRAVS